jgi:hypothetical protein
MSIIHLVYVTNYNSYNVTNDHSYDMLRIAIHAISYEFAICIFYKFHLNLVASWLTLVIQGIKVNAMGRVS